MSSPGTAGSLGSVTIRLAEWLDLEDRYQRNYIPVTPASREIAGAEAAIAPETTIATWHIDDFAAGEGDVIWRNRNRYNESDTLAPANDGSGTLVVGPAEETTQYGTGGSGDFDEGYRFAHSGTNLFAARYGNGTLWKWDGTEWDTFASIGGTGVTLNTLAAWFETVYATPDTGQIRKVTAGTNSQLHSTIGGGTLVIFDGRLYHIDIAALHEISTTVTDTATLKWDGYESSTPFPTAAVSDIGLVWAHYSGAVYEYNVYDDVGYKIGQVFPAWEAVTIGGPAWYNGIYIVPYAYSSSTPFETWLWIKAGGLNSIAGPVRDSDGKVATLGFVGDRFYFSTGSNMWGYDLSSGAFFHIAEITGATSIDGVVHQRDLYQPRTGNKVSRFTLTPDSATDTGVATLLTGRHNMGYLGLNKILTKVTVNAEAALTGTQTIGLEYAVDGGSFTAASGNMTSGESSKTWTISTNAATVRGIEFEFKLKVTNQAATASPRVLSMTAEAVGAEARVEWNLAIDVGESSTQDGQTVLQSLKGLVNDHNVVQLLDPWQYQDHTTPAQYDVTIEEMQTPEEQDDYPPVVVVRLRSVATV